MSEQNQEIFDVDFALNQFSGNQSILLKILDKFLEQNLDFSAKLQASLLANELELSKRQIHTLKGVAGNLGLQALHVASKKLEPLIGDTLPTNELQEFNSLVEQTIQVVTQYMAGDALTAATTTLAPDIAPPPNTELFIAALKRNEFLSDAKLEQFIQPLSLSAQEKKILMQYIDDFDYSNAISMLSKAIKH